MAKESDYFIGSINPVTNTPEIKKGLLSKEQGRIDKLEKSVGNLLSKLTTKRGDWPTGMEYAELFSRVDILAKRIATLDKRLDAHIKSDWNRMYNNWPKKDCKCDLGFVIGRLRECIVYLKDGDAEGRKFKYLIHTITNCIKYLEGE